MLRRLLPATAAASTRPARDRRSQVATLVVAALVIGLVGPSMAPTAADPAPRTAAPVLRADEQLLVWDPVVNGHAVAVVGDLAAASVVAIVVPGVGNNPTTFEHGLGGVQRRAPLQMARSLAAQLRADAPGTAVAVVAWQGYDPPAGVGIDVVTDDVARDGAARLASFVTALRATRPQVPVTLVGHSYGALVAGLAAQRLRGAGGLDLVLLGAPGAGVESAADLAGTPVFTALAADDWIRRIPQVRLLGVGHGRRPASPTFGATALPVAGVHGHDHYLDPGTTTLQAIARICLRATR